VITPLVRHRRRRLALADPAAPSFPFLRAEVAFWILPVDVLDALALGVPV
jgi:hypothetical protein